MTTPQLPFTYRGCTVHPNGANGYFYVYKGGVCIEHGCGDPRRWIDNYEDRGGATAYRQPWNDPVAQSDREDACARDAANDCNPYGDM